ncbi:MFS transporter xanthine/uracil permease [Planctomycetales bacterium 10988]|nr:MFS transporter xanthine/uracil permease [Planctomycetales bacterium 10988]
MTSYRWITPGDLNAFFGLMLDNLAVLVLTVSLLSSFDGYPTEFAVRYLVPGTAFGVLIGDLIYTWMEFRLAKKTGSKEVTAMPLGLDTPSTFGMIFFVLGPAYLQAKGEGLSPEEAARYSWHIGIGTMMCIGVFKVICSFGAGLVRKIVPRAGLLGSLAAVALVLIAFFPMIQVLRYPIVGFLALSVILTTLVARYQLPWKIPGGLAALLLGGIVYYLMDFTGVLGAETSGYEQALPSLGFYLPWAGWDWLQVFSESLQYLPVVLPLALATVVGGIDCTESAAAAGDEYHTGSIVFVEAFSTLVAGFCGGVVQSTPYIGHPAYKAMGGRAAYTLATGLFIGGAGIFGWFSLLYAWIPAAAIYPILIFIGLEITAQSYQATPTKHYPAVAVACIPALAYLVMLYADQCLGSFGESVASLAESNSALATQLQTLRILSGSGGFILTSLLWGAALAYMIDRRWFSAAMTFCFGIVGSLFGIIHSPLPAGRLVLPWNAPFDLPESILGGQTPFYVAAGYAIVVVWLGVLGWIGSPSQTADDPSEIIVEKPTDSDEQTTSESAGT